MEPANPQTQQAQGEQSRTRELAAQLVAKGMSQPVRVEDLSADAQASPHAQAAVDFINNAATAGQTAAPSTQGNTQGNAQAANETQPPSTEAAKEPDADE